MIKYCVHDLKYRHIVYDGFDEDTALRLQHDYNNSCGDYYLDEEEIEEPEELNDDLTELAWLENRELTAIWGDDEAIKKEMKSWIEAYTESEVEDFDLTYSDPGDSGDNANFFAHNIKYKD